MIRVARARLRGLGECHGFALELSFRTDLGDPQFESFADALYAALEPVRLVNVAARIADHVIELDTADVLGDDSTSFLRDVQTALRALACDGDLAIRYSAQ